ncbi:MAG: tRNA (adenosine(37)-N6)-threonylcarbamoyltransferase complex ATPase subunit type 1 TsaE [Patescibacteria group bacterium]|nr:tRNA (adenosine(37)-N6)-threonylcarbamoyltransferase complex ATPase subunit type 1 TsaE [Patescibacteria group bacterium]MDD4303938.1 tRNA (adenosine(37)-N6)-threonylcarbamoyltransferase complex ATPase subunit type 1 TsaE [Patescibacteria group bacterium]MDD4695074.1 tRNA (adenosine(37)-N6)-threonylcarbamoyltransferase complex ATPase subunit type 1 TsaE [Patescibacteria group bacterium]
MTKHITKSLKETRLLGKKLTKNFNFHVIGLNGDLGAGKTAITKGIGGYFGIENITSPTFVVMKIYKTLKNNSKIKNVVHIDCYRLETYDALLDIGLEDYINDEKNLIILEWANKICDYLPKETIYVNFKLGTHENERIIEY